MIVHLLTFMYFYKVIEFGNLYKGLKYACKNVRWKDSVVGYENNALKNTISLKNDIQNGKYEIQKYQHFKIYEPKQRDIIATRIRDRQFQRALCDGGLYKDITEHFIYDNCACQKGRGTDFAIKRMKCHLQKYYRKHGNKGWVLKCDIHHFFPTTDHTIAKEIVNKHVDDSKAKEEVYKVIDSFDVGIGLGSEISQLIELLVLNDLDHFIKEKLRIKHYIRYMDDFVLIHEDKMYLKYCLSQIEYELSELHLELNKKTSLFKLEQGIWFLHWKYVVTNKGKVLMLYDKKKIKRERRRLKKLLRKELNGDVPLGTARTSFNSWLSSAKRGNTYRICKEMTEQFNREEKIMNEQIKKRKALEFAMSTAEETYNRTELTKEASDKEIQIEKLIREKYSLSQEVMLHRKKLMNDLTDEEWNTYTQYIEWCIEQVE